jgi:acetone carboxylase beta subunit
MENGQTARRARVLAIDAGGTLTDTFIVDENGAFAVGKAQTTPEDESLGFMRSSVDALKQWGSSPEEAFPGIASGIFSGTAMLNRLLSRAGLKVGVIVTAGQEDVLEFERGIQTYLGYSYSDRLHAVTHYHKPPLVPRERVKGVRGRIDMFGDVVLPLREADARVAAAQLLDQDVDGIVVSLLFSYLNSEHEQRVVAIVEDEIARRGRTGTTRVYRSSEIYPSRRDLPRLNTTVIEAYAAEPSRGTMQAVKDKTVAAGANFDLRVMAAHGGTISTDAKQLAPTLMSGPIGGVVGGRLLADELNEPNVLCTDIGGTSFDMSLITDGRFEITDAPDIASFLLNIPLVRCDSVGAGTGSYVRIDPNSGRPEIGPDSAGSRIGVSWPEGGVETVTITDLNLVLGRLDPGSFLGGELDLDVERARREVERQIAAPLGLSLEEAAAGVIELFESALRNEAIARILGKGYTPEDYVLLCYGGGGPLHVAGYVEDVQYKDVLVPAWAAGFSAFGCACADYEYRFDQTVDRALEPGADDASKLDTGAALTAVWKALEDRVAAEFAKSGVQRDAITFTHGARMQYLWQLNDIEVNAACGRVDSAADVDALVDEFERAYAKIYARSARSPELGYSITQAIVSGRIDVEKPVLPNRELAASTSAPTKGVRSVYWRDGWQQTDIYELDAVQSGHEIHGPAIVEAPAMTFTIPAGSCARLDPHDIFHLRRA